MKYLYLFIIIAFTACKDEVSLHKVCGNIQTSCYGVWTDYYQDPQLDNAHEAGWMRHFAEKNLLGPCQLGTPVCDEDYNIIDCKGAVYPKHKDICDGIDNNCDGDIDNDLYPSTPAQWDARHKEPSPCNLVNGVCQLAQIQCQDGEFQCLYPDTYELEEVTCDGLDNDCDARIDNIDREFIETLCFNDDFWKATNGSCRAGIEKCVDAQWQCVGQVLPSPELCDGIDNNCNGIMDDTEEVSKTKYDIVFIIDTSGSMCGTITSVGSALDAYVEQFEENTNFRFAIVDMSSTGGTSVVLHTPFTDISVVRDRLFNLDCDGVGEEASLDSMYMVCDDADPLILEWKEGANRLFFAFTDEQPQSYTTPITTSADVIETCLQTETVPFIWSYSPRNFIPITSEANGMHFRLVNDWEQIFDDMNTIIATWCSSQ